MRPKGAAVAGIAAGSIWMGVLIAELERTGIAHSLVARPDRILGWEGAAFQLGFVALAALAATLAVAAAVAWRPLLPGRVTHHAVVACVAAAALAEVAIQYFTPDHDMYQTSPLRGTAAWLLIVATPAAAAAAGLGLLRGRGAPAGAGLREAPPSPSPAAPLAGAASLAASVVMVWLAADIGLIAATGGASQPETEVSIAMNVALAAWVSAMSLLVLALPGRKAREEPAAAPPPEPAALPAPAADSMRPSRGRSRSARAAIAGLGGLFALVMALQMAASLMAYSYLGPQIVAQLGGRTRAESIEVAGITRTYRVHEPATLAAKPGLIISLSGVFGDGFQAEWATGFDDDVDRLGWVAVYPDSVLDGWMAYGWDDSWGNHPGADDVPFLSAIIDREIAVDRVDAGRVFVTGMSRGGMFTHRAGCELADKVAAIAPVAGNMATVSGSAADVPCHPSRPISVLATHGTADATIPFNGGKTDITFAPFKDVMAKWRSVDGCGSVSDQASDDISTTTAWRCASGTMVAQRVIDGGGHSWPGDASRVISDFFVAHARD